MTNKQLPAEVLERIKADAIEAFPLPVKFSEQGVAMERRTGYIAGATAVHERAQVRMQKLIDVLEKIVHAPVPANEREYMSWFVTAKNIAGGAISEWEAENGMHQWNGEGVDNPPDDKCRCIQPNWNSFTGKCLTCGKQ